MLALQELVPVKLKKKVPNFGLDNIFGQVWVGINNDPICIPANSVKVVEGKTKRSPDA